MSEADVFELKPREKREVGLHIVRTPTTRYCECVSLQFEEHTQEVECRACMRKFEPFQALMHIAKVWHRLTLQLRAMREEKKSLTSARDSLQREIANLKAQKRRAVKS